MSTNRANVINQEFKKTPTSVDVDKTLLFLSSLVKGTSPLSI